MLIYQITTIKKMTTPTNTLSPYEEAIANLCNCIKYNDAFIDTAVEDIKMCNRKNRQVDSTKIDLDAVYHKYIVENLSCWGFDMIKDIPEIKLDLDKFRVFCLPSLEQMTSNIMRFDDGEGRFGLALRIRDKNTKDNGVIIFFARDSTTETNAQSMHYCFLTSFSQEYISNILKEYHIFDYPYYYTSKNHEWCGKLLMGQDEIFYIK